MDTSLRADPVLQKLFSYADLVRGLSYIYPIPSKTEKSYIDIINRACGKICRREMTESEYTALLNGTHNLDTLMEQIQDIKSKPLVERK